jgi:phospholipid/cholesterol/gamma-HCH transport system substrate-binding protein
MDEKRGDIRVGALALAALAVAVGLVVVLGGLKSRHGFSFQVDLAYAGGLPAGAIVKVAGVNAGHVRSVDFRPEGRDVEGRPLPVRVTVDVDAHMAKALRTDAQATVATQGALGETYLEVEPGTAAVSLAEGTALRGIDPPRLDRVFANAARFFEDTTAVHELREFLVHVGAVGRILHEALGDDGAEAKVLAGRVEALLTGVEGTMADVRETAHAAKRLATGPAAHRIVEDLSAVSGEARRDLPALMKSTRALLERWDGATRNLGPDDVARLQRTLSETEALVGRLDRVSASAGTILAGIERGEGTAGLVVKDPKVYQDLRDLLDDLRKHPWKILWK